MISWGVWGAGRVEGKIQRFAILDHRFAKLFRGFSVNSLEIIDLMDFLFFKKCNIRNPEWLNFTK
jgi:hypothetical protein